jgi:hypothetical protein
MTMMSALDSTAGTLEISYDGSCSSLHAMARLGGEARGRGTHDSQADDTDVALERGAFEGDRCGISLRHRLLLLQRLASRPMRG